MSHYNLEKELSSALKLDGPLTKGPTPRWERKRHNVSSGFSIGSNNSTLNVTASRSSASKTPSKTPKKSLGGKSKRGTPSRNKTPKTPIDAPDRFIPSRSGMQFDICHHLVTQNNSEDNENLSPNTSKYRTIMSENLNGDLSNFRIMAYKKKAPLSTIGQSDQSKILYSSSKNSTSKKTTRYIPQTPERILDAPEIIDDYYLNLIDWSSSNFLAVALSDNVYIWNASTSGIHNLMCLSDPGQYVTSVSWLKEGNCLAVGNSAAEIELWDVETKKKMRVLKTHSARIATLAWNSYILSSGSRSGLIHHSDVRIANHHVGTMAGHNMEVCGLQWSPDRRYLASGGNDNTLNIWPSVITRNQTECRPLYVFSEHRAAVKAVSWCPWQPSVLATGSGTLDKHIRFFNSNLGTCINAVDTNSQIGSILWSSEYKELISGHGFENNELTIWKYPSMTKVTELLGHTSRVLSMAMSPDGTTVISAAADETLRLWNCFAVDPKKKKAANVSSQRTSSKLLGSCIR